MLKNIEMTLKKVKLPESKSTHLAYAKYVTKVSELVCTLLVMQGDVASVVRFVEESLPKVVDIPDLPSSEEIGSKIDVQEKSEEDSPEKEITLEGEVQNEESLRKEVE